MGDEIRPGRYRLHSRFARVSNFFAGDMLVSLVGTEIGPGPVNLVAAPLPADPASPWLEIAADGTATLGGARLDLGSAERYDSRLPQCADSRHLQRTLPVLAQTLLDQAPAESLAFLLDDRRISALQGGFAAAFASHAAAAITQIFQGDPLTGVGALRGSGLGLTPSGDDFNAGLLLALNLLAQSCAAEARAGWCTMIEQVYQSARGQSLLSNAFLELASRGRVFARMKALIAELCAGEDEAVEAAAGAALLVGATSGADLAVGLYLGLTQAGRLARF